MAQTKDVAPTLEKKNCFDVVALERSIILS